MTNLTSLTSRESYLIRKESQKPSVSKIYLFGFNHDSELLCHSGDILCENKEIRLAEKNFGAKTLEPHCYTT